MTYASEVLADSPRAYYRLGEASGTTMNDASGNSRNGTYIGSPTLGSTALILDTDTCMTVTGSQRGFVNHASWMDVNPFTAECWFRKDPGSGAREVFGHVDTGITSRWMIRVDVQAQSVVQFWCWTGSWNSIQANINDNQTYHVVGTYDGTNMRLYLDGTLVATSGSLSVASSSSAGFGIGAAANGAEAFSGKVDEVAFYGTALSGTRIAAHHAAGITAFHSIDLAAALPTPTASFALDRVDGETLTLAGTVPTPVAAFVLDLDSFPTTGWAADITIGGVSWSVASSDTDTTLGPDGSPLTGMRIGWRYPNSDVYPVQPEPVTATVRILVDSVADILPAIDEGSAVTIDLTGGVHASFVGRVAEMDAVPVKRKVAGVQLLQMLFTFRCVDYTVDRAGDTVGTDLMPAEDSLDRVTRILAAAGLTPPAITPLDPVPVAARAPNTTNVKVLLEHYLRQWPITTSTLPEPHRAILSPDGETVVEIPAHTTGGRVPAILNADGTLSIDPASGGALTPWVWNARQILFDATWSRLKANGVTAVEVAGDLVGSVIDDSGAVPRILATIDAVDLVDVLDAATLAHMYRSNVDDNGAWVADAFTFLAYVDGRPLAETGPILAPGNEADVLTGTVAIYNIPPTQNPAHPGADWFAGTLSAAEVSITGGKAYLTFTLRPDVLRPPDDDPIALTWDDLKAAPYTALTWDDLDPNITWADARLLRRP